MLTYIEKLRTRPKAVRVQIAFVSAVVVTGVVVLGWLVSLPEQFSNIQTALQPGQATAEPASRSWSEKVQTALGIAALPDFTALGATDDEDGAGDEAEESVETAEIETDFSVAASNTPKSTSSTRGPARVVLLATTSSSSTVTGSSSMQVQPD